MIEVFNNSNENENELNTLNKLIADEQEAIEGYFKAAKNSTNPILIKLYSDIGDEERFHTEQLLQAKAMLTGEVYKSSDPEVDKEYIELSTETFDESYNLNENTLAHYEDLIYSVLDKIKNLRFDVDFYNGKFEVHVNGGAKASIVMNKMKDSKLSKYFVIKVNPHDMKTIDLYFKL